MGPTLLEANNPIAESEQPIISCNAVRLAFGTKGNVQSVLNDLSLAVHQGQIVSLLGPSGCGKSTLLRVIAGLIEADAGSVIVDGAKVARQMPRAAREKMSFVFQEPALLPWRTVWQNVMLPSQLRGVQQQTKVTISNFILF